MKLPVTLALGACCVSTLAAAAPPLPRGMSLAHLATPAPRPVEKLIDGRFWSCSGDACTAHAQDGADSQPLWMECSHAAAEFGAFTDYQTGSDVLDPARLQKCDARAKGAARR